MHYVTRIFEAGYLVVVALFVLCAFTLMAFGGIELWTAVWPGPALSLAKRFEAVLECIAMLTIAMASLELADTILQEEFSRETHTSHAARMRSVLSRFLVVVVIALAIESLVATFKFVHDDPSQLFAAAAIAAAAAALLGMWAAFFRPKAPSE